MFKSPIQESEDNKYTDLLSYVKQEAQHEREGWRRRLSETFSEQAAAGNEERSDMQEAKGEEEEEEEEEEGYGVLEARQHELLHLLKKLQISKGELETEVARLTVELHNERKLTEELRQDLRGKMKEFLVLLPESKERAVVELYNEVKKLEISRRRLDMSNRVADMREEIEREKERVFNLLQAARRELAIQGGELIEVKSEWERERRRMQEQREEAEEAMEAERRKMFELFQELLANQVEKNTKEETSDPNSEVDCDEI
ncbi:hypothetical protein GUITHDRAFT_133015 [Guillardia theta CCMP2712]|uniref:Uncharacterized protein n=1 Tax=Guillardia theta (strain CCMP2712) TaxID=905079 RepID=L1JY83_GUITC|nr:hypothetical protein GUITHDRAFT_133015 [Guillardia theta CCMP2712]EKX53269.1 hypothetical protein GUITHDRAFT_133015 [Guillardia theta CCMP2712]|eukprot:XP_005840249.1 hypothetical protein GUITHDRAFT_133015 [Guillardia theta CCMP2712]